MEDIEDAPEELTRVEGEDAAEILRKQEVESKKRLASELKSKRRKQNEANRKLQQEKLKKKLKKRKEEHQDPSELAGKNCGFLDASVVEFLVEKERKEATEANTTPAPQTEAMPKVSIRKRKKKLATSTSNDRTKVVIPNEKSPHTLEGTDFWHKRLHASKHRSLEMLKPKLSIKKRRFTR